MNQLHHMNRALDYIEDNLDQEIDYKELAKIAMVSESYFKRVFSFLAEIPLSEYIRNRCLSLAAYDLQQTNLKVIDVAVKYGYGSSDAFSRAFQQLHGLTPTQARQSENHLKMYPRLSFRLTIEGGEPLNYRLVKKEAFKVVGYMEKAIFDLDGKSKDIDEFFSTLTDEHFETLSLLDDGYFDHFPLFLASDYYEVDGGYVQDFYAAVSSKKSSINEELNSLNIPSCLWAVFTIEGDWTKIDDHWTRIYTEWFPSTNYEPGYSLEFMLSKETTTEIWIALKEPS